MGSEGSCIIRKVLEGDARVLVDRQNELKCSIIIHPTLGGNKGKIEKLKEIQKSLSRKIQEVCSKLMLSVVTFVLNTIKSFLNVKKNYRETALFLHSDRNCCHYIK